jgi:hypothetical protein
LYSPYIETHGGVVRDINRADCPQDVYRPRGGSIHQWDHLVKPKVTDDPYGEADELARISNDLWNQEWFDGDTE